MQSQQLTSNILEPEHEDDERCEMMFVSIQGPLSQTIVDLSKYQG